MALSFRRAPGKHDWPDTPKEPRFVRRRAPFKEKALSRRSFSKWVLAGVTALVAAALGGPAIAYVASPMFRKREDAWRPIGRVDKAEAGEPDLTQTGIPVLAHFSEVVRDAYFEPSPQNTSVYVLNEGDGKFTVYDIRCTHLGCPVSYEPDKKQYFSPCHAGVFDEQGRVTGGPPPRPLDRYEVKVEESVLYVGKLYRVNGDLERVTS